MKNETTIILIFNFFMNNQHQAPKKAFEQQNYEQDYEKDQQNDHLEVIITQKQPKQKFVSLIQSQKDNILNNQSKQGKEVEQKGKVIEKLKNILHSKIEQIKEMKKNINNCRKQIKQIGEQVDKQMNKSIIKHSKPQININIQEIFQMTKNTDPQINHLTNQLSRIRGQSKKIKTQIKNIQNQVQGPLSMINIERAAQIKSKTKECQLEIKQLKQQKQYLQKQLKMIQDYQNGDIIDNNQQIKLNRQKNNQLLNELKEQKYKMYQLDKQDRLLTQKIKYVQELQESTDIRKSRATVGSLVSKQEIQLSMKQILDEIRQIIQKRNKIQNQRKATLKSLENEVASLQAKNWDLINKLRQIDSKLLKHYNSKIKKKPKRQSPNQNTMSEDMEVKRQKNNQNPDNSTLKIAYSTTKNDKNLIQGSDIDPEPVVLVEKRKNYQFFMNASQNQQFGNIILNDQMLGVKLNIKRLSFVLDQDILYGVSAQYENQQKYQVKGYKIMSRIRPKELITKTLIIDNNKGQVINLVHVGIDKNENIKYLQIVTSQAKQFKWGSLQNCEKNEQKNIRKYESIQIKGKLNQVSDKEAPNYYCLSGFGFSIIYLSPK